MKTSRKEGKLVLTLDKGYTVAHDGQTETRKVVFCDEFGHGLDSEAMDLDQAIMRAMAEASQNYQQKTQAPQKEDNFFGKDSPTEEEVAEYAFTIEMAVSSGRAKVSDFMELFTPVLDAGLIKTDTGVPIHKSAAIWQTMDRHDKAKVVYSYCAFFANPLERLSATASKKAKGK